MGSPKVSITTESAQSGWADFGQIVALLLGAAILITGFIYLFIVPSIRHDQVIMRLDRMEYNIDYVLKHSNNVK